MKVEAKADHIFGKFKSFDKSAILFNKFVIAIVCHFFKIVRLYQISQKNS